MNTKLYLRGRVENCLYAIILLGMLWCSVPSLVVFYACKGKQLLCKPTAFLVVGATIITLPFVLVDIGEGLARNEDQFKTYDVVIWKAEVKEDKDKKKDDETEPENLNSTQLLFAKDDYMYVVYRKITKDMDNHMIFHSGVRHDKKSRSFIMDSEIYYRVVKVIKLDQVVEVLPKGVERLVFQNRQDSVQKQLKDEQNKKIDEVDQTKPKEEPKK